MIFAAATDENTLFVFASAVDAIAYCEAIDVEEGGWIFWDEAGDALQAEFLTPNHRGGFMVGSGSYRLIQATDGSTLAMSLAGIRHLDGNPYFDTLEAVRVHLATTRRISEHGVADSLE
jgi:hypothetical protein